MSDPNIDSDQLRDKLKSQGKVVDGDALHGKQVRVMHSQDILNILKDMLAKLGHKDNAELIAKITELEIRHAQARDKIAVQQQEIERLKAEMAKAKAASDEQIVDLQADLAAIRTRMVELEKIRTDYELLKGSSGRAGELEKLLAAALAEKERLAAELDALRNRGDEMTQKLSERDARILELNKQLESTDQGELGMLRKRVRELEKQVVFLTEALIRAEFGLDYFTVEDKFGDAEKQKASQDPRGAKELAIFDARMKRMLEDEASIATIVEMARAGRNLNAALERLGVKRKTVV
jgi:chromosome segregation ATPase